MDRRRELGRFLNSRRARLKPQEVGAAAAGNRRVPGLRREELAMLAGVSVDYYTRLEQGRAGQPSDAVLDALADALRLDHAERIHLFDLARSRPVRSSSPPAAPRPGIQRLLDLLDRVPAQVVDHCGNVLAWNALSAAIGPNLGARPPGERNAARYVFLDPEARVLFPDWEEGAEETVASLRLAAGRHPDDPELTALIDELTAESADFRRLWAARDVQLKGHGTKRIAHPTVGMLTVSYESFVLPGPADQTLTTYTTEAGSESERALDELVAMVAAGGT
jgi:transcriptional regulator with XRE-family HTH domain